MNRRRNIRDDGFTAEQIDTLAEAFDRHPDDIRAAPPQIVQSAAGGITFEWGLMRERRTITRGRWPVEL